MSTILNNFHSTILTINLDQFKLIFVLLSILPFSILFHLIQNSKIRLFYSMFLGIIFQFQLYGFDVFPVLIGTYVCYWITKNIERQRQSYYVLILTLFINSVFHIIKMLRNYGNWKISITFIYMMMICRYSGFSFCYADGELDENKLTKEQSELRIKDFTILEYFSYIYFFPASVIGPFYEFNDFKKFIYLEDRYKNISFWKCLKESIRKLKICLFFAVIFIIFKPHSNPHVFFDEKHQDTSLFYKFLVCNLGIIVKYKYYIAFLLNESMLAVSGISYDGEGFNLIKHINIWEVEKTKNAREFFKNWNISVYLWLKRYVFTRLLDFFVDKNGKKQTFWPKIITPVIAAFWHGLYPNYYIVFFHIYLSIEMIEGTLKFRNKYINVFLNHYICQVIGWYVFFLGMNYYYYILSLLDVSETIRYLIGMKFSITIMLIISFILVKFGLFIERIFYGKYTLNKTNVDEKSENNMKND